MPVERKFFSGTENTYSDRQLFAELGNKAVSAAGVPVMPSIDTNGVTTATSHMTDATAATQSTAPAASTQAATSSAAAPSIQPQLGFSETVYEAASGQDFTVKLTGKGLAGLGPVPAEIIFNGQVVSFVNGTSGEPQPKSFSATADGDGGVIKLQLEYAENSEFKDGSAIASISLHAANPGISYLMYRVKPHTGSNGEKINVQIQASRIVVK